MSHSRSSATAARPEPAARSARLLWLAAGGTLLLQLWLCHFFAFGAVIPMTNDVSPAQYVNARYWFPPTGYFLNAWWLGDTMHAQPLTLYSLLAHLPVWLFFTAVYPLCGAIGVLAFYRFLRELELPPLAAVVGGVLYGWQGHLLSNIYSGHFAPIVMLAVFPLALGAGLRALRPGGWRWALLAGALTGMLVAMGDDQGALAALLIGAVHLTAAVRARGRGAVAWRRILGKLLVTIVLAVLVAAPKLQMGATFAGSEVKPGGTEDARSQYAWATQWSWPPEETFQFLVPGFFGWKSGDPTGPYWGRMGQSDGWEQTRQGFRNFSLGMSVIGTLPCFLLCVGIWWGCRRRDAITPEQTHYARFFALVGAMTYLLSLGKYTPVHEWFYQLPYMSAWRNPVKLLLVIANFSFLVLAAYGVYALTELVRDANRFAVARKNVSRALIIVIGLLGLAWLVTLDSLDRHGRALAQAGYSPAEIHTIGNNQLTTTLVAVAVLGGAWIGWQIIPRRQPRRAPALIAAVLSVLTVGQMYWVQTHYIEPFNARGMYRTNPLLETLARSPEPVRVKFVAQDRLLHHYLSHTFAAYDIATLDVPAASRVANDYALFFDSLQSQPARLWQIAGVKYLVTVAAAVNEIIAHPSVRDNVAAIHLYQASGTQLDDLTVQAVSRDQPATHALIELRDYFPKALVVPQLEILADDTAVGRRLAAPDWNPRASLLVTAAEAATHQLGSLPAAADRPGTARVVRYGKRLIEIDAETRAGGYLLINDRFDPAWHARINGQPASLFRANVLLRGLELPAGSSRIVLRYQQPLLPGYLSLAAYVLTAGVFLSTRKRPPAR